MTRWVWKRPGNHTGPGACRHCHRETSSMTYRTRTRSANETRSSSGVEQHVGKRLRRRKRGLHAEGVDRDCRTPGSASRWCWRLHAQEATELEFHRSREQVLEKPDQLDLPNVFGVSARVGAQQQLAAVRTGVKFTSARLFRILPCQRQGLTGCAARKAEDGQTSIGRSQSSAR